MKEMYMNPATGSVQPLEDWIADYHNDAPELWPGVESDQDVKGVLIKVALVGGAWVEAD